MRPKLKLLFTCIFLLSLSGCKEEHGGSEQFSRLSEDLKETLKDAKRAVAGLAPDTSAVQQKTNEEIEKLFRFEYKVEELAKEAPAGEIEASLARLGSDRWDCFHVESTPASLRLFCKRMPRTYLRYLTHVF